MNDKPSKPPRSAEIEAMLDGVALLAEVFGGMRAALIAAGFGDEAADELVLLAAKGAQGDA